MKEFVQYLIETIAKHPEAVSIEEQQIDTTYIRELVTVHPEDMGLVIGRSGKTIQSVRELAKAKAIKDGVKVDMELVEPDRKPRGENSPRANSSEVSNNASEKQISVEDQVNAEVEQMAADLDSTEIDSEEITE
ncbi:KH domain-containing protein [Patescibacteria group bacterium]|nr:KH domain-containing protein [Patescibacteria group bacterium]